MSFFKTISSFFNPTTSSSSIPSFNKSNVNLSLNNNSSLQSTSSLNDSASRLPSTSNSASFNIPNSPALHPFPPPSQFPPLDLSWNRIKKWSKMRCPELVDTLNKPASILALDAFELHVGFQLPPAVRDYFLVHDGQELESDGDGLLFGLHLLPIDDVLEQYQFWRSVDDDQQINGNQYILSRMKSIPPGWIKTSYSNPAWLPLATDRMGNYIGVDLDPPEDSSGAIPGQVILFGRDIDTKIVVCNSDGSGGWGKFFSFFADLLENNQCSFSNDKYNENYSSSFDSIGDYLESSNKVGLKVGGDYLGWDTLESFFDRSLKHWLEIGLGPQSPPAIHLESPQGITKEISIPNHTNNDNNSKSKGKERALTEPIPSMNNYNEVDNINDEIKKSRLMSISTSENGRRYKKSSTLNLPPVTPIDLPTPDHLKHDEEEIKRKFNNDNNNNNNNNRKSWILPSHLGQITSKQNLNYDSENNESTGDITELRNFNGGSSTPTLSLSSTSASTNNNNHPIDSLGLHYQNLSNESTNNLSHFNNDSTIRLVTSPAKNAFSEEDLHEVNLDFNSVIITQ